MAIPLTTATTYDEQTGLIKSRTLADGRVLRTQKTDAQHGATTKALNLQSPWAAWLQEKIENIAPTSLAQILVRAIPKETIASDIEIDPFDGLKSYTAGNGLTTKKEFDIAGRMTQLTIQKVANLKYSYGVGPRIKAIESTNDTPKLLNAKFEYRGFGSLVNPDAAPPTEEKIRPMQNALGQTTNDGQYRYTYTPAGQVETVSDQDSKQIGKYAYNSLHQRISKTVNNQTTYFLWQQGKLVAEINGSGNIEVQYLYFAQGQHTRPIAKLEQDKTYFIHTDHRATPMAMTDDKLSAPIEY